MRISDWSSDVCSSDLGEIGREIGFDRLAHDPPACQIARRFAQPSAKMLLRARARQAVVAPIFLGLLDEHIQHPQPLDDPPSGIGIEILVIVDEQLPPGHRRKARSEEHTSELQSLMRISYAVFCLNKKINKKKQ